MNKKKNGLISLIIILVGSIGIGYVLATINNRSDTTSNTTFDIQYKNSEKITYDKSMTEGIAVEGKYINKDTAKIRVTGLKKVNDYASATYTVENVSKDLSAKITADITTEVIDSEHYKVEVIVKDGENVSPKGGTCTVTVKISLIKAVDNINEVVQDTFKIKVKGIAIDK